MSSRILTLLLIMVISASLVFPSSVVSAHEKSPFAGVQKYIEYLNSNNWNAIPKLWAKEERRTLNEFIQKKENLEKKLGLFNIKKANLIAWKELPLSVGSSYVPSYYLSKYKEMKIYYIAVNLEVHKESKYFINGTNYSLAVIVQENGEWKFALHPVAHTESLILAGYGFGTEDEKTFTERRLRFLE